MLLVLTDLDTGLFLEDSGWTADYKIAQAFNDPDTASTVAEQKNIKNAAAAYLEGEPPRIVGFRWLTKPS